MRITGLQLSTLGISMFAVSLLNGCNGCNNNPPTTTTTMAGKSVATLVKTSGLAGCAATNPITPLVTDWWNTMAPANHQFPFAGWRASRSAANNCSTQIEAYRALVTFNMASVSSLKGLVSSASLVVKTQALPPATQSGGVVTAGPSNSPTSVTLMCPLLLGGGGTLQRFGPAAASTLPTVSGTGELDILGPTDSFPSGQAVYTFPATLNSSGPVAGAVDPTTVTPSGNGGSAFSTDVTSQVNAALNGGAPGMSWMLTANAETLPTSLVVTGVFDCRTSYDFELQITHY